DHRNPIGVGIMELTVLIEPAQGNGCRASAGAPLALATEGATREEALNNLRELIEEKIRSGAELLTLEVGKPANPWARFAGTMKDDPLFDDWVRAMAE